MRTEGEKRLTTEVLSMLQPLPPGVERSRLLSIRDDLLQDTSSRLNAPALDDSTKKGPVGRGEMIRGDRVEVLESKKGRRVSFVTSVSALEEE
jgi:hypothetical protein